jgi:hypothetical protein
MPRSLRLGLWLRLLHDALCLIPGEHARLLLLLPAAAVAAAAAVCDPPAE